MTNYYGILDIINKKYCKQILEMITKAKNITDVLAIRDKLESGVEKGYFSIKSFVSYLYDYIKFMDIDNEKKIETIILLADIERNSNLLLKNITYDNILVNIFEILKN
jgi:hypothetical protein